MNSIGKLNLQTHDTGIYVPFKGDLYTAEIEWNGSGAIDDIKLGPKLSWDAIRPSLYRVHSQITKLFNIAVGDSKMTEDEKTLENIRTLISEKRYPKPIPNKKKEAMEIKIVGMPDLNVKNIDERAIIKNKKKITLPSFPRTEWAKVSIKFIDDRNILLSDGKETKPSSFEGLGCSDTRSDKPDDIWEFLIKVARGSGSTPPVKKNVREKQTKQKQKITDILRNIFDNDTDPFEKEGEGIYKAKFHIEYLIQESISTEPNRKYLDLEEMRNEMTTPKDDSKDNEFS
jgi:hypothetical protein